MSLQKSHICISHIILPFYDRLSCNYVNRWRESWFPYMTFSALSSNKISKFWNGLQNVLIEILIWRRKIRIYYLSLIYIKLSISSSVIIELLYLSAFEHRSQKIEEVAKLE